MGPEQQFDGEDAGEGDQPRYRQVFLPQHGEIKEIPECRHAQHERQGHRHDTNDHCPPAVQRPRENNQHPQGDQRQDKSGTGPRPGAGTRQQGIGVNGKDCESDDEPGGDGEGQ